MGSTLNEDCKLLCWNAVTKKIKERVPGKYLALMANQLCDGLDPADFDAANELKEAVEASKEEASNEQAADVKTEVVESDKDMTKVLEAIAEKPSEQWNAVWSDMKI